MQLFVLLALLSMAYLASVNATKATTIQIFEGITCSGQPVATNILSLISCSTGRSGSVSFACGAFEEFFKPNCQGNSLPLANFSNICIPNIRTNQSHTVSGIHSERRRCGSTDYIPINSIRLQSYIISAIRMGKKNKRNQITSKNDMNIPLFF